MMLNNNPHHRVGIYLQTERERERERERGRGRESERERGRERERERERERFLLRSIVNMMIHVQIKITMKDYCITLYFRGRKISIE